MQNIQGAKAIGNLGSYDFRFGDSDDWSNGMCRSGFLKKRDFLGSFNTKKNGRLLGGGQFFCLEGVVFLGMKTLGGDYLCIPKTNWEMMPM